MFDVLIVKHIAFAIEQVGQALKQLDHIEEWTMVEKQDALRESLDVSLDALRAALIEATNAE